MSFDVLSAGPLTTIQDGGRLGQAHLGLSEGGPMDFRSFALANRLVGNHLASAALEITLGGLVLTCITPTTMALTGAHCPLKINGKAKALWQSHRLSKDDIIEIGFTALGVRAYLAVAGGFKSPCWFQSQATVVREKLGQAVGKNQRLEVAHRQQNTCYKLPYLTQISLNNKATLEFLPGYQWNQLTIENQHIFLNQTFSISAYSDRMGCQLEGPSVNTGIEQIYSEGIAAGSIQVTGEGRPIILLRDRQTIGGYPKLGAITTESQSILAQLPQGSSIRFQGITPEDSIQKLRTFYRQLEQITLLPCAQ